MSENKFYHEAQRWIDTASEDLRAARALRTEQLYAQACFMAQQCGEKSLKAMWYAVGQEPTGQSIQKLIMQFPEPQTIPDMDAWRHHSAVLDKYFSATRYPNELPDLTPGQSYFAQDADQAIEYANTFLRAARQSIGEPTSVTQQSQTVAVSTQGEPHLDLSSPDFRTPSATMLPPQFESTSSGEEHVHRRRRSHSWQGRVTRFFAQRETWGVAITLIVLAILLSLIIVRVR